MHFECFNAGCARHGRATRADVCPACGARNAVRVDEREPDGPTDPDGPPDLVVLAEHVVFAAAAAIALGCVFGSTGALVGVAAGYWLPTWFSDL